MYERDGELGAQVNEEVRRHAALSGLVDLLLDVSQPHHLLVHALGKRGEDMVLAGRRRVCVILVGEMHRDG